MQASKTNFEIYLKSVLNAKDLEYLIPEVLDNFQLLELQKNDYFVEAGSVCKYFCYIESGILQHSIDVLGDEKTTYLALKNSLTSALNSFKNKVPSRKSDALFAFCETFLTPLCIFSSSACSHFHVQLFTTFRSRDTFLFPFSNVFFRYFLN